jgi:DMSO reductase anchor subunit
MHPAFSVIFLTTLIGVGQGLFLALMTAQFYAVLGLVPTPSSDFYVMGSLLSVMFLVAGLVASFFHLGHPERAWRSAARWRTSWLSREVIVLPAAIGGVLLYALIHYMNWDLAFLTAYLKLPHGLALVVGIGTVVVTFLLFLCTGMIYACIKFLQEWATPLTVVNYTLFGLASGFLFATAYAAYANPMLTNFFGLWAAIFTVVALLTRAASLIRNARIKRKSSLQTAIGVRHTRIQQKSQGFMGGSFNTREFFHGVKPVFFKSIKWVFLILVFPVPLFLLWAGLSLKSVGLEAGPSILAVAFGAQYLGLIAERWFFFAQANHPQNLYYQTIS